MQLSTVLEVVLALSFLFATLSLVASGANEMISAALGLRARTLKKGIANLLSGEAESERKVVVDALYGHPLIASLYRKGRLPSYIPKQKFALALIDEKIKPAVGAGANAVAAIPGLIDGLPDGQLKASLDVLWRDANDDVGQFRRNVEGWFDDSMERVSGWYRRLAQIILGVLGVVLAVGLNVNAATVAQQLWRDAPLRAAVVKQAEQPQPPTEQADSPTEQADSPTLTESAKEVEAGLKAVDSLSLPIGWDDGFDPDLASVPGWLFTAIAISMGAPFWFDLLGRVARLRSTGVRTQTAVPDSAETEKK
ncbi:MAG: hypothetical protein ACR2MO_07415 [Acidimicrobiales bacterium]